MLGRTVEYRCAGRVVGSPSAHQVVAIAGCAARQIAALLGVASFGQRHVAANGVFVHGVNPCQSHAGRPGSARNCSGFASNCWSFIATHSRLIFNVQLDSHNLTRVSTGFCAFRECSREHAIFAPRAAIRYPVPMLRNLRAWLANKLHPPIAPPPASPTRRPLTISRRVLDDLKGQIAPVDGPRGTWHDYQFPELPPGVLPADEQTLAFDAELAPVTGEVKRTSLALDSNSFAPQWGWLNGSNQYGCGLWFPGYPYLAELTQISEYRAPSETTSTEMTRKWFELQTKDGGDKSAKISKIMARLDELKVRHLFRRAALLDGEFGRAQIYLNINDADDKARQLPLCITPEGIPKGSLKSIQCIEPYWSTPYSWNAAYPERADFYVPTSWYIMGRKTHASRLLTFIGREVPDILKPAYNFGGMSLTQLMEPYVNAWLRTRKAVNDLINNFSIPVLATNLAATLQEGGEPGSGLLARLQMFTLTRNNQAIAAINKDEEELKFAEATLASLDKLQAQSQEHMAAPAHVPLIKLFGVVPTGLNATGEGEIQVWYDWVNASQVNLFQPHLETLLKVVQLDLFGAIDDDLVIHWVTLDEPTQKELSEIRKSDADMDTGYINVGVISPDEARSRLQNDPDSGYENLTGNAPEPEPDPDMLASMENDNEQAGLSRQHELDKMQAKPEPAGPPK